MAMLFVAPCPICTWKSEPRVSVAHAREERRTHLNGHPHADLVEFVTFGALERVDRFEQS